MASHYVRLFGGNKIGNFIFWLPLIVILDLHVKANNTGRFMFSVITNSVITRKPQAYFNRIVHSHRKIKKVFFVNYKR
jgi:hypothetical protein